MIRDLVRAPQIESIKIPSAIATKKKIYTRVVFNSLYMTAENAKLQYSSNKFNTKGLDLLGMFKNVCKCDLTRKQTWKLIC